MIKMIRQLVGGTWIKLKANDDKQEYWLRPSHPAAIEMIHSNRIVKKEHYQHSLAVQTQR